MSSFLIPMLAAFKLLGAPDVAVDKTRVAQAVEPSRAQASGARALTDRASARLESAQRRQRSLQVQMATLRRKYNKQLSEVDRLKRARASWRRDRLLREQKARSQKTALALRGLERKLRTRRSSVSRERKALAQAIDRELSLGPSRSRREELRKMLGKVRSGLKEAPKRIAMPELELDELADPEELVEQIRLIERAEARLAEEEASLQRREKYYAHMDALRSKRRRADALGAFEDDNVRRTTGRVGSEKNGRAAGEEDAEQSPDGASGLSEPSADPAPGAPSDGADLQDSGGGFRASSIVLADVLDAGTQSALRRAQRSSSPRTKAQAAKQARRQVSERLRRLRASKARIRRHLKRLPRH